MYVFFCFEWYKSNVSEWLQVFIDYLESKEKSIENLQQRSEYSDRFQNARLRFSKLAVHKRYHDQDKFGDSAMCCVTRDSGVNQLVRYIECLFIVFRLYIRMTTRVFRVSTKWSQKPSIYTLIMYLAISIREIWSDSRYCLNNILTRQVFIQRRIVYISKRYKFSRSRKVRNIYWMMFACWNSQTFYQRNFCRETYENDAGRCKFKIQTEKY